ncbi:hypothetical protein JTE90_011235 [Oedothorax gibbosus]|uniref:Microtubule-associated protein Jupiter n=1 Tax=Oedothorax gibbosus TaxID=931172 RepID=A0AAV6VY67_9ARAC|nr:hypothetical protein JTE90_011235 [Oedothorax gibbosus]
MTSTEFTVGLDGSRASSKVLRPPGGGSSDIFGMGSVQNNTPRAKPARGGGGGYSDIFGVGPAQNSAPKSQPEPPSAQETPANQPEPPSMPEPSSQPEAPSTPQTQPEVPSTPETAVSSPPEPVSAPESNASAQNTPTKPQSAYAQTQNRLFGGGDSTFTPGRRQIKTNMFAHQTPLAPPPPRTTYDGEVKTEEEPAPKPVTTSIRVRNPPGGHSSGIF